MKSGACPGFLLPHIIIMVAQTWTACVEASWGWWEDTGETGQKAYFLACSPFWPPWRLSKTDLPSRDRAVLRRQEGPSIKDSDEHEGEMPGNVEGADDRLTRKEPWMRGGGW
jgi:hypothetical protein